MENFLKNTFIFSNVKDEEFLEAVSKISPFVKSFQKDEIIFSPTDFQKNIGFIMHGKCTVSKSKSAGIDVPLNTLSRNDSFGVISILSERDEYPTSIIANELCQILFLNQADVLFLIENYNSVSLNFIKFLAEKINFLNDKISTFSAYNVEQKLSNYLLQQYRKHGGRELCFSRTECAMAISAGRASLYRALDSLRDKGIINLEGKKLIINDLYGLERNSK